MLLQGKLRTTEQRDLINEEEDLDSASDTRSINMLAHTSMGWIRVTAKRMTQVSPEGTDPLQSHMMEIHPRPPEGDQITEGAPVGCTSEAEQRKT